jgi:hypothetical protein
VAVLGARERIGGLAAIAAIAAIAAALGGHAPARAETKHELKPLSVAVIKSTAGVCPRGQTCHVARAGQWTPKEKVAIVAASIPEQTDVDLYADIEISTAPEMYLTTGHIFRAKYAGPRLFDYGASSGNTYLGSNVTTTNISFPSGYGIVVPAGTPVYVHLDVRNQSLIDVDFDQDCYLYYVAVE